MSFFEELKRRNVARMAVLYAVASWVILQVADVLFDAMKLLSVWARSVLAALLPGFPVGWLMMFRFDKSITRLGDEPGHKATMTEACMTLTAQLERAREVESNGELAPLPE